MLEEFAASYFRFRESCATFPYMCIPGDTVPLMSNIDDDDEDAVCDNGLDRCIDSISAETAWKLAIILALGNAADAIEILCIGFIMNELDTSTEDKELLSAAVFMGMLVGGLLCGILSDKIGRKPCLVISLSLNAIAGIASAMAPSVHVLIACRVCGGLGIGGSVPSVFTLGAEIFPTLHRGRLLSVIASFWMVGALYTGATGWLMLGENVEGEKILGGVGWRAFAVVSAFPALVALLCTVYVLPESPRFLVRKGYFDDAAEVLSQVCTVDTSATLLREEAATRARISGHGGLSGEPNSSSVSTLDVDFHGDVDKPDREPTLSDNLVLLFSADFRTKTLLFMCIWFMLSFGSYGISTWAAVLFTDVGISNVYAATFIYACANLPGNIASILYMDSIGRQRILQYGMGFAAISIIGFAIDTKDAVVVVLCAALFNAFSVAGWNALDCMTAEEFPTQCRTTAMGVIAASGRLGAISAQFVNGSLQGNIPLLLFVTSGCMVCAAFTSSLLGRDTTGKALQ